MQWKNSRFNSFESKPKQTVVVLNKNHCSFLLANKLIQNQLIHGIFTQILQNTVGVIYIQLNRLDKWSHHHQLPYHLIIKCHIILLQNNEELSLIIFDSNNILDSTCTWRVKATMKGFAGKPKKNVLGGIAWLVPTCPFLLCECEVNWWV